MTDARECPEREHCEALKGAPIGMYHCNHCGQMLLAGQNPTPYCPRVQPRQPAQRDDTW